MRPRGVPAHAIWIEAEGEWQVRPTDDAGLLHGDVRSWRADGSLHAVAPHVHGKQSGAAWSFHPDGRLYTTGGFVDGTPRGIHRRYANPDPRAERIQSCCVPEGACELQLDYAGPGIAIRKWFNRDGARLQDSGAPYPDRPRGVPIDAWFNENSQYWEAGVVFDQTGYTGTRSCWSTDGVLRVVEDLKRGKRHGIVRSFTPGGRLEWEAEFSEDALAGWFRAHLLPPGQFALADGSTEEGTFEDNQAVGWWRLRDAAGAAVVERDLGQAVDEEALRGSPVLADRRRPADDWRALSRELFAAGRVGGALLALARAAAECGDGGELKDALAGRTLPLLPEAARGQANELVARVQENDRLVPLVDALKRGLDAGILLWTCAKVLRDRDRAALDLVSAALLLAPSLTEALPTRALLRASVGDLPAARADIARIEEASPEQARLLALFLRAYFPRFDFWPARETLENGPGESSITPDRSLPEIVEVITRYATRLGRLRAALIARVGAAAELMLPDLSALLPGGPVALSRWTFTMSAAEYSGGDEVETDDPQNAGAGGAPPNAETSAPDDATVTITVDETAGLDVEGQPLLTLMRQARADWSGLVWLCWAAGLDAPALPAAVDPPAAFGRAAVMTMERVWRCRDKLNTAGLLALTKGVPGFDWEGAAIDLVPATLAAIPLEEYVEARAVFSWLCDAANKSPWQDDLRRD